MAHVNEAGYVIVDAGGKKYREHRLVWIKHNGDIPDGYEVDHINGVRHDNRIENLRLATRAENGWNHKPHKHSILGVKGVRPRVRGNCTDYECRVTANKVVYRTYKPTLEAAVAWVRETRTRLHGEFANHGEGDNHRCL